MSDPARAQVLRLAPDSASMVAAQRLARSGSWRDVGGSERGIWGLCAGSAAAPYETVVDLAGMDGACTCPSRKRPCKHVLALLLLWTDDGIGVAAEPQFVTRWFDRRSAAAQRAATTIRGGTERGSGLADPDAAAKRAAERRRRVDLGLTELDTWLRDQVRAGLATLPRAGYGHFDAVAARMVDAQAPGVAGTLRGIPGELVGADWPERALHALGGLRLLVRAHQGLDRLPPDLAATVRSRVGYPVSKDEVLRGPGVADRWHALAAVDTIEFQLESRRVWLLGERTGRWAVWLAFAVPGQPMDTSVQPGQLIDGDLHFYPGSGQHRALVGAGRRTDPVPFPPRGEGLAEVRAAFAELLAADPWASRMPALVRGVPVAPDEPGRPWLLADGAGETCSLEDAGTDPWMLLAHSCGDPISVFGEWHGGRLLPLAVLAEPAAVPA
ncbi:SWIM zinc finger family protein [Microlunatus ginsengisoli]